MLLVSARYAILSLLLGDGIYVLALVNHKCTTCISPAQDEFRACAQCDPEQAASASWCAVLHVQPEPLPCDGKHQNSALPS